MLNLFRGLAQMANSEEAAAYGAGLEQMVNAVALSGVAPEWLSVPFADVPYDRDGVRGIQRLDAASAGRFVAAMEAAMAADPRFAAGLPMYVGHPDYWPRNGTTDPAEWLRNQPPAYGWIRGFRAAANSLDMRVEWTDEGRAMVESKKYRFFSPLFLGADAGTERGTRIYEPRLMRSAGLVNTPNWPMPPLVNAADATGGTETQAMPLLQRLIALLGDAALATEDAVVDAVQRLVSAVQAAKAAVDARWKADDAARMALPNCDDPGALFAGFADRFGGMVETLNGAVAASIGERDAAILERDDALARVKTLSENNDALSARLLAATTAHAATLVNAAVARGAVLQEHAATRIAELVNAGDAFADRAAELAALPKLMKTEPAAGDAAGRSANAASRRAQVHELVNAAMAEHHLTYDAAFGRVRRAHPALFGE